ncbi:MAG TPA: hypothetical protein VFQ23_10965 [Anaerolineales bacterium]|nr:hypothetical protein [Anaerolineales bacterium]
MSKKNRKQDRAAKLFDKTEIESIEAHVESKESAEAANMDDSPELIETEEITETSRSEEPNSETLSNSENGDVSVDEQPEAQEAETSTDLLFDDVRQSLIEDETVQQNKKSKKWWRRVAKGLQKEKSPEAVSTPVEENSVVPVNQESDVTETKAEEVPSDVDEIDELINMLETESAEVSFTAPVKTEPEVAVEPEIEVDIEELKKQALRPRGEIEEQETITEVRSVALEDGEEVFVEVESTPQDPLEERLSALENALRPYRRYIYFGFTVFGIVLALIASAVLFNVYRQSRPAAPTEVSNLPYPTAIRLPGGLNFTLGKGSLQAGQWNPQGPEWLQGTEVCRWIAIPWSTQIEAVIRTLNPEDPIELTMSNNDHLVYKVYSIQQLTNEELQRLPSDSPCLMLILAKAETETRWVLTALP